MKLLGLRLCTHDSNISYFDGTNLHYHKSERKYGVKHHAYNNLWQWQKEIKDLWNEVMKNGVANYTTDIILNKGTLYIKLKSSVLREELSYGKEKIIKLLNERLKKNLIKKIVLR